MNRGDFSSLLKASLIGLIVSVFYLGVLHPFSILEIPRLKTQDLFFQVRHFFSRQPAVLNDIVLVSIDDESIKKIGERWPFKRGIYATFLEQLADTNPRAVGFDFIFSGRSEALEDFLLTRAIEKSGRTVLASLVDSDGNYVVPFKELHSAGRATGAVNKLLDKDLCVRRSDLLYRDKAGRVVGWPWEIEVAAVSAKLDLKNPDVTRQGIRLRAAEPAKDLQIPFYDRRKVRAMINYHFALNDIDAVPFWKVIQGKEAESRFSGKIVLVGAVSRTLHDYYHTPLGLMPGVVVNMNFLANLLARDFLKQIPLILNAFFLFLFVSLSASLTFRDNVAKGLSIFALATLGLAVILFVLFLSGYVGDYFTPFFGGWVTFVTIAFYRYFRTFLENVQLKGKVVTDPLTGLYNRRILESQIDAELEKLANVRGARKTDPLHELSILMIDIDDFKKINDTYGHQFGDDALRNVSFSIKENIRKDDFAARFGGEEFCVVLPHTTKEEARQIAEKIRASIQAKKFNYINQMTSFTASIGVASAKTDNLLASRTLIRAADTALYEAKKTGKNKVCLYQNKR